MASQQILELVEIFSDLTPEQLERIYSICREVVYMQDEVIFTENSPSTEFYVILEGEVKIQVDPDRITAGKEKHEPTTISILRKGQSFGEIALVDQGLRSASAVCSTMTCKLFVINRDDLMNLLKKDPEMGFKIMTSLAADLCFKVRQTTLNLREALLLRPKTSFE